MTARVVPVVAVSALWFLMGCQFSDLQRQMEFDDSSCVLSGTVRTDRPNAERLVVVLLRRHEYKPDEIVDHYVVEAGGQWRFYVLPGRYALAAFDDINGDGAYEEEPALVPTPDEGMSLDPGEHRGDLELEIPGRVRPGIERIDLSALEARSLRVQDSVSLGQLRHRGKIVTLDDPRFDPVNGKRGLWNRVEFLYEFGIGIFFLEPCDPGKTPILFVHGMVGGPRDFAALADVVDRTHFQPWFFYYPSGYQLDLLAEELSQQVVQLADRCRTRRIFVVAHSLGGLVARGFIERYQRLAGSPPVELFVSLSTPWAGAESAELAQRAPDRIEGVLPPSIEDVARGSQYIQRLFYDEGGEVRVRMPNGVAHQLLFGHHRDASRLGASSDRVISTASAARWEAVEEAASVYPIDENHRSILGSPVTVSLFERLLEDAR